MNEFKIDGYDYEFRIAKMNAIDMLAMRTQLSFDDMDQAKRVFNTILEYIEVRCDSNWLPVKTKGLNVFFPPEVETDFNLVESLVKYFTEEFLQPVFRRSNA